MYMIVKHTLMTIFYKYIRTFTLNSKEEIRIWTSEKNPLQKLKYCQHCKIHDNNFSEKHLFEQLPNTLEEWKFKLNFDS